MSSLISALLILPADKSAVGHGSLRDIVLWLFVEGLRSFALLHLSQVVIMVIAFKEFLNAGPFEFCLMLKHLF